MLSLRKPFLVYYGLDKNKRNTFSRKRTNIENSILFIFDLEKKKFVVNKKNTHRLQTISS